MALILILIFIALAVLGRSVLQYKMTGSFGLRPANPRQDPTAAISGSIFIASFCCALLVASLAFFEARQTSGSEVSYVQLGFLLLGLLGITVVLIAQWQMGDAWRIGVDPSERTQLITAGLYRNSRNPIYFGILLFWVGFCGLLPEPLVLLLAIISWTSIEVIVRKVEEPYLLGVHGSDYEAYQASTRRYLP